MNGKKNSSYDYRLLIEDDLKDELSDDISQPTSTTSSLRSLRLPWHVIRIPFKIAIKLTLLLPFGAFIFAIVWALYMDYDKAVNVLCTRDENRKVRNYLPSLSAAIGDYAVSQTVWTLCIVIHAPPRFLYGSMYLKYFETIAPPSYYKWSHLAWILSVLEILGLIGLSIIPSKQNLPVHAFCFATFLIASELYMVLQCIIQSSRTKTHTWMELKSLRIKKFLTKLVLVCSAGLVYTYIRHETYCEVGVYTMFAALEYIVILSNMAFHGCSYWDFYDRVIVIDFCRPLLSSKSNNLSWSF